MGFYSREGGSKKCLPCVPSVPPRLCGGGRRLGATVQPGHHHLQCHRSRPPRRRRVRRPRPRAHLAVRRKVRHSPFALGVMGRAWVPTGCMGGFGRSLRPPARLQFCTTSPTVVPDCQWGSRAPRKNGLAQSLAHYVPFVRRRCAASRHLSRHDPGAGVPRRDAAEPHPDGLLLAYFMLRRRDAAAKACDQLRQGGHGDLRVAADVHALHAPGAPGRSMSSPRPQPPPPPPGWTVGVGRETPDERVGSGWVGFSRVSWPLWCVV